MRASGWGKVPFQDIYLIRDIKYITIEKYMYNFKNCFFAIE